MTVSEFILYPLMRTISEYEIYELLKKQKKSMKNIYQLGRFCGICMAFTWRKLRVLENFLSQRKH